MTVDPLVSIVLPTYNGARYLEQATHSCLEQTYRNWVLIIVDDASTDETPQIIAQMASMDRRIRVIRHEQNCRLPAALNTGFAHARGEYLTWTSDDNLYRPMALEAMVSYLQSNPNVDVVYTDHTRIDEMGHPFAFIAADPIEKLALENVVGPCFLYRRKIQETLGGYSEDLFLVEDYDFWLRASIGFHLQPLHEDLYLYRCHAGSLTAAYTTRVRAAADRALVRHLPKMSWLMPSTRIRAYFVLSTRAVEHGLSDFDVVGALRAIVDNGLLESEPQFVTHHLIYAPGGRVRNAADLRELLSWLPDDTGVKAHKRLIWGHYHAIQCFEGYRLGNAGKIRNHFPHAVWCDPNWLRNRQLLRIGLWAATH